jgi:hypothetical protein
MTAGPLGICYDSVKNVELYHGRNAMLIAGREDDCIAHLKAYQDARAKGCEVLQYIVPADCPDKVSSTFDKEYYGTDTSKVPKWPFPTKWSKWPGTTLTDISPGSAWIIRTVTYCEGILRSKTVDGLFLDTVGAMPWVKIDQNGKTVRMWDLWTPQERDVYTAGNVDLVRRLRALVDSINPSLLLISNSTWARDDGDKAGLEGEKYVNGVCLEHHKSTSAWHRNYIAKPFGSSVRRALVIANSVEEAQAWAEVPGVTHVSSQATGSEYAFPPVPPVPLLPPIVTPEPEPEIPQPELLKYRAHVEGDNVTQDKLFVIHAEDIEHAAHKLFDNVPHAVDSNHISI